MANGSHIQNLRRRVQREQDVYGLVVLACVLIAGALIGWCLRGVRDQDRYRFVIPYTHTPAGTEFEIP